MNRPDIDRQLELGVFGWVAVMVWGLRRREGTYSVLLTVSWARRRVVERDA